MRLFYLLKSWVMFREERGSQSLEHVDPGYGWSEGTVTWECLPMTAHGFNFMKKTGDEEIQRQKASNEIFNRVGEWLLTKVFA